MTVERVSAPLRAAHSRRAPASSQVGAWCLARRWALVVWGAMVGWSAALMVSLRNEYLGFRLSRFDLGNMVQAVSSTAHGRPLEMTDVWGDQVSRLGFHVDPILMLFAPLWLVAPTPLTLIFVNVVALTLGALPVFWLARKHLGSEGTAALLALTYLAYPWLAWNALDSFHPVSLAIPLLLFSIWFLETDRLWRFAVCALLILSTGELMGATIAALGLWYTFARGRRRAGFLIACLALAWSAVALYVVVPAFSDGPSVFFGYYGSVGGSPVGLLRTVFTRPQDIVEQLITGRNLLYVVWLAAPVAGMFFLAPGLAAVALPQFLANELSDNRTMTQPEAHHSSAVIPILIAATVLGIGRLTPERRRAFAVLLVSISVLWSALLVPWPGGSRRLASWDADAVTFSTRHVAALRDAVRLVPDGAAVTATNKAGSHLSARRYFYSVPVLIPRTEWVVLDMADPFVSKKDLLVLDRNPQALSAFRASLERDAGWSKVFERSGVLVFRRNGVA
jgi:uncharacterized membrane protein